MFQLFSLRTSQKSAPCGVINGLDYDELDDEREKDYKTRRSVPERNHKTCLTYHPRGGANAPFTFKALDYPHRTKWFFH